MIMIIIIVERTFFIVAGKVRLCQYMVLIFHSLYICHDKTANFQVLFLKMSFIVIDTVSVLSYDVT